ncbi:MAG TPA: hypothetical protein H9964_08095 [Candidatus Gallimonas intestinavium]|uniref:Signal peptidase I n=1 Tax=Candidatus Gallimonas intestinavium TaxID=2838603 RepID=A0A9D2G771_9FIRM|nr:hypothetical protein [Candidatus Gallimonas intestinavium]
MRSDQEREGVLPEAPADGAAEPAGYDRPAVSPAADMTAEPEMGEGAPAVEAEAAGPEAVEEASAAPEAAAEAAHPNAEETAEPNAAEANAAEPEAGEERVKARPSVGSIIGTVLLAVLCVILIPLLAVNITLIVKGALYPDELTDVFNIAPVAIDNTYMEGENEGCFNEGALVFIKTFDTDEERQAVKQGDVVAFRWLDDDGSVNFTVYRILGVTRDEETGLITSVSVRADNVPEGEGTAPIPVEIGDVVGILNGSVDHLGAFAMFLMQPLGVLLFVGVPVVIYVVADIIRITIHNRKVRKAESDELRDKDEEIARLRALVEGGAAVPLASASEAGAAQAVTEGVSEGVSAGELYDEPLPELTDETSALSDETAEEISDEVPEMTDDEKIN